MNEKQVTMKEIFGRWRLIVVSIILFALIAFIGSVIMPAKYQSDISVIVVQEQASEKVDAFSATKSAEFLSNIFTRVIYTTSFFNDVQDAPFDVRRDFSQDSEKRSEEWKNFISVKKVNNTGIIHISVFDESRKTAEETAKAAAYILTTKGDQYHGGGERVTVRLIDGPNTPLRPTLPRILPNTVVGGLFGGLIAIVFIYFFPNKLCLSEKKRKKIQGKKQEKIIEETTEVEEENIEEDITSDHFKNAPQGAIEFDANEEVITEEQYLNPEIEELHDRINNFNKNN